MTLVRVGTKAVSTLPAHWLPVFLSDSEGSAACLSRRPYKSRFFAVAENDTVTFCDIALQTWSGFHASSRMKSALKYWRNNATSIKTNFKIPFSHSHLSRVQC